MIPVWKMSLDQMLVNFWQGGGKGGGGLSGSSSSSTLTIRLTEQWCLMGLYYGVYWTPVWSGVQHWPAALTAV